MYKDLDRVWNPEGYGILAFRCGEIKLLRAAQRDDHSVGKLEGLTPASHFETVKLRFLVTGRGLNTSTTVVLPEKFSAGGFYFLRLKNPWPV